MPKNTFETLKQELLATVTNPDAQTMAKTLDRALTALVENQEVNPSTSFFIDYYNLERLRTAIRSLADGTEYAIERGGVSCQ